MLLQLGNYKFEGLKLPISWGLNFATNYAQIPIIDGKPVVQKIGERLVEQELSVLFSDEFCIPADELNSLQISRRNGVVLQCSGGDGTNYGKYVITDIGVINSRANDTTGYISAIECSIKLLEYNSASTSTVQTGAALKSKNVRKITPVPPTIFPAASIHSDIKKGVDTSKSIKSHSNSLDLKYKRIVGLCNDTKSAFTSANNKIQNTKKIIQRAKDLQSTIQRANSAIDQIKNAANGKNIGDLMSANTLLETAMYDMQGASAPLAAFVACREGGI